MDVSRFATHPIRPGSTVLRVYNDGLTGFVYDRKHEAAIRRSRAALLYGIGSSVYGDGKSMRLLASGTLLLFGLHQDDGLAVEVVVGPPLTADELAGGPWLETRPGWIDLPSGALCLHSYNSLPMGDNDASPEEAGGRVAVPAGRYEARMYRKDFNALEGDDAEALQALFLEPEPHAIHDVLVLTPMAEDAQPPSPHNVLFGDCIDFDDPALRAPRIVDGVWSGRIGDTNGQDAFAIDFTEDDARLMGLRCGDRLLLRCGELELPVFFWGERHVRFNWRTAFGPDARAGLPDAVVAEAEGGGGRLDWSTFHERRLDIRALGATGGLFALPVRSEVTVRVAPVPYIAAAPPGRVGKGVAQGEIVASTGYGLVLGIDDRQVRKLRLEGGAIEIEAGGHRFVAAPYRRPDYARFREPPSRANVTLGPPVWELVPYVAGSPRPALTLHLDPHVRFLTDRERAACGLPLIAAGTPVTVRAHAEACTTVA